MLLTFIGFNKKNEIVEASLQVKKEEATLFVINEVEKSCIREIKRLKAKPKLCINVMFNSKKVFIIPTEKFDAQEILKNYE